MSSCNNCGGSGHIHCDHCHGTGEMRNTSYIPVLSDVTGIATDYVTCMYCHGEGEKTCSRCGGSGEISDDD